jgi:acetyltransferase-like isoleucine patch superfamily enzyme
MIKNDYAISEILKNVYALLYTRIFFNGARLIRRPFYIRGRKHLKFGKGLTTGYSCRIEMFNIVNNTNFKVIIGKNCKMGDYVHIAAGEQVIIGDNCLMASKVYISDINHGDYTANLHPSSPEIAPDSRELSTKRVKIGNNVWLGENVCVLPGAEIGNGCVIGANTLVNKKIADNCIAVGSPARVIKQFNFINNTWMRVKE